MYLNLPNHVEVLKNLIEFKPIIKTTGNFPLNISFLNENYLDFEETRLYDTILCFSTSK